ncbi:Crp/Fnr family transcriptional regulator [Cohnella sp. JJ-181]|uniref:Crp/Fnr family transcriptional regulator n=1 Tax=Cohnella rhizoplanae TaxID=2974897 RepID=UPI0022FF9574|nr:helix-turn-helix domain-containing protein [Cohnella sp. JJ-181]CAI6087428.1 Regulatory protein YeiL [Cohnella sp. JJ-181]
MKRWKDPDRAAELLDRRGLRHVLLPETLGELELRSYGNRERVCEAGEPIGGIGLLARGKLKVYTTRPGGGMLLFRFTRPPSVIGDVEWLHQYPVRNHVESVGESLVLFIGDAALKREAEHPAFLRFVVSHLSHKLFTMANASSLNQLVPVRNRLAGYLLSLTPEAGSGAEEYRTSTLTETAELLGTSYRHLNRVIERMVDEGILARGSAGGALIIKDAERLKALAADQLYS